MTVILPEECHTMEEVRAGVDATDAAIISLLKRRFAYMRAAARIKPDRSAVRDEGRKAQVIANVRDLAAVADLPVAELSTLWDGLVEASIAYEAAHWDRLRAT